MPAKPRKPIPNFTWNDVRAAHNLHTTMAKTDRTPKTTKERKPMNKTLKLGLKIFTGFACALALAACALMTSGCQVNVISASPVTVYSDTNTNTETLAAEEVAKR